MNNILTLKHEMENIKFEKLKFIYSFYPSSSSRPTLRIYRFFYVASYVMAGLAELSR